MSKKLQIESLAARSSSSLSSIERKANEDWGRFRYLCERDAVYIAAMAQQKRAEQRDQWVDDGGVW